MARGVTLNEVLDRPAPQAAQALVGSFVEVGGLRCRTLCTRTVPTLEVAAGQVCFPEVPDGHGLAVGCATGGAVMFTVVEFYGGREIVVGRIGRLDGRDHVSGPARVAAALAVSPRQHTGNVLDPTPTVRLTTHLGDEDYRYLSGGKQVTDAGEVHGYCIPRDEW